MSAAGSQPVLGDEGPMPDLRVPSHGSTPRLLTRDSLRGKVVSDRFLDILLHQLPARLALRGRVGGESTKTPVWSSSVYIRRSSHSRKSATNVEKAVRDLKITYPVAIDSDYKIWQAFNNQYWPAHYFIDGKGRIRYHHFGEGEYDRVRARDPGASQGKRRDITFVGDSQRCGYRVRSSSRQCGRALTRNLHRL